MGCASKPAAKQHPPGLDSYIEAVNAYESGDMRAAMASLIKATRENPDLIRPHVMLGEMYKDDSNYRGAADEFEHATKLDPYGYENYYNLGVSYQFLNRLQEAAATYLRALELKPSDVKTNMNLGLVYLSLNHPDDALRYVVRATELGPQYAPAWANLGVVYDVKRDYSKAEHAYRRSLEYDSKNISTLMNLGDNLMSQNKPQEAISVFTPAIKVSNSAVTRTRLGDALYSANRAYDAMQQYNFALKLDPKYFPAMNSIGRILIGKYHSETELDEDLRATAVRFWKRSLEISPEQPKVAALVKEWEKPRM